MPEPRKGNNRATFSILEAVHSEGRRGGGGGACA